MKILGLLTFILNFGFFACSIDTINCTDLANQNEIHQDLDVSYDATDDETTVNAYLRVGGSTGTTIKLDGNCTLTWTYDGTAGELDEDSFLGTNYSGGVSGIKSAHTFVFTNNAGTSYSNSITLGQIAWTGEPAGSIAAGVTGNFTVTPAFGSIANDFDNVYLTYDDTVSNQNYGRTSDAVSSGTSVTVAMTDINGAAVPAATYTFQLRRQIDGQIQNATTAGGDISSVFYTTIKSLAVHKILVY